MDARMEDGSRVFQPALPMRGVTRDAGHVPPALTFQPALPMRGVTQTHCVICSALSFQPALPMRGVTEYIGKQIRHCRFQPALPMRGVTWARPFRGHLSPISTRTPHAGSDEGLAAGRLDGRISTRTPHAGSDRVCGDFFNLGYDFNPHSPCGECRRHEALRRAAGHFNPHSPCGK